MIENMTNEQAAECLKTIHVLSFKDETATFFLTDVQNAFKLAIKALDQQPCEDCISRQAIKEMLNEEWTKYMPMELDINLSFVLEKISELPSVTPKSEDSWKEIKIKLECDDCISREAVFKIFDEACYIDGDWYVMREKIEKLPSVTQTRPKGKWKILDECANEGVYCSKCHKTVFKLEFSHTMKWRNFKYCPNCGAKMEAENEKETC